MATDRDTRNRPQQWEDDAPAESRFRRVQQGVPPSGRVLPGMPLEMADEDEDDLPAKGAPRSRGQRFGADRFGSQRKPWWKFSGSLGRALLVIAILAALGGVATAAYFLKAFLGSDSRFRIAGTDNIQAAGLTEVSREQLNSIFGEDIGRNIFFVPLGERRRQLEEIPWVERATIMRVLPDRIRVQIVERKPVAFVLQDGRTGLIDADGVLLTMPAAMMAQRHYSFPVLTGIDAHQSPAARKARMDLYMRLIAELDSDGQRISDQISQIDLTDQEDARVTMPQAGGDILAHFGEDHFLDRYQRYKTHIAEWRQQYPKLATVDLRYEQQVVLDMDNAPAPASGQAGAPADSPAQGAKTPSQPAPAAAAPLAKSKGAKTPSAPSAKSASSKAGSRSAGKTASPKFARKTARQKAEEKAREKKRAEAKHATLSAERKRSAAHASAPAGSAQ